LFYAYFISVVFNLLKVIFFRNFGFLWLFKSGNALPNGRWKEKTSVGNYPNSNIHSSTFDKVGFVFRSDIIVVTLLNSNCSKRLSDSEQSCGGQNQGRNNTSGIRLEFCENHRLTKNGSCHIESAENNIRYKEFGSTDVCVGL
jgi:hypothetical protein